ncbi:hypothetical protein ACOI1C_03430 [Bacillus sp. DJP31]|uniref:hypothetical protein n=1 Tax=Bacillus sp. DJP31 TaxID=3409789 RepID=UPI003BB57101
MILRFTSKQIKLLIVSVVLIILIYAGCYYLSSSNWKNEMNVLTSSLKVEEQQVKLLEETLLGHQDQAVESTLTLQEKLPVVPLVEQLMLDLEMAETISESFISNMSFTEGTVSQENSLEQFQQREKERAEALSGDSEANAETEKEDTTTTSDSDTTQENEVNRAEGETLNSLGLEKIEVSLSVESPSYFEMKSFLNTIEGLTRIVRVESLSFAGQPELTSLDQTVNTLKYTVIISTFYFPSLEDLKDQLPPLETPSPSQKLNPFISSTSTPVKVEEKLFKTE